MRIKAIHVDGFGGVGPLDLSFSPGLNVFVGPNEAGKTCLMEFIKAVFFGLSKRDKEYQRYLPLDARPYGGRMVVEEGDKEWVYTARFPGSPKVEGGEEPFPREMGALLYDRVFSLGLAQVSNLALLSDDEVAQHLYSTALGPLGRAYSLAVGELDKEREALFKVRGKNPEINRLLAEIRSVEKELAQLRRLPGRYGEVLEELKKVEAELEEVTEEWRRVGRDQKEWDTMARAYPLWSRLREIQRLMREGDFPLFFPPQGVERLEVLEEELKELEKELEDTRLQLAPLERALAHPLEGAGFLAREGEVAALKEEWALIKEKMNGLSRLETRLAQLRKETQEGLAFLGLDTLPDRPTGLVWDRLKEFAERFSNLEKERLSLEKEMELKEVERERRERDLDALKEQEPLKPPLSRDEVLARQDFISQARDHLFATPTLWQLGFSFFFILLGAGGMWTGLHFQWPLVKWGGGGLVLVGLAGVVLDCVKRFRWKGEARRLARRLEVETLDRGLLDDLETDLKALEDAWRAVDYWKIKCSDVERTLRLVVKEGARIREALEVLEEKEKALLEEWEAWLGSLGLPEDLSPQGAQELLHKLEDVHRAHQEIEALTKEREALAKALDEFGERVNKVAAALDVSSGSLEEKMTLLGEGLERARREKEERRALEEKVAPLKEKGRLLQERLDKKRVELETLLKDAGVTSLGEFREKAVRWEKREALEKEARKLRLQLATLLGGEWEERVSRLESLTPEEAQGKARDLTKRGENLRKKRDGLIETRTRLLREKEELEQEEREQVLAQKREELLDRLREALLLWSVDTLALELFKRTREVYERENQPRVLKEASRFFSTMTGGRYVRVYIPMGSHELWVEREGGHGFSSRYLSRGTGEQLYLALSMAIMLEVANRGMAFPVVLDDILVNFDPARAARAVEAIGSLATRLQVLFFTCHPHIGELFSTVGGVEVVNLGESLG